MTTISKINDDTIEGRLLMMALAALTVSPQVQINGQLIDGRETTPDQMLRHVSDIAAKVYPREVQATPPKIETATLLKLVSDALSTTTDAAAELAEIKATLVANFGPGNKEFSGLINGTESIIGMLISSFDGVIKRSTTISVAVGVMIEELRKDPGYRMGWKANIAMALVDAYMDEWDEGLPGREFIHAIANKGADRFLDMLTRERATDPETLEKTVTAN